MEIFMSLFSPRTHKLSFLKTMYLRPCSLIKQRHIPKTMYWVRF